MEKCPICQGTLIKPVEDVDKYPRTMACPVCSWPFDFSHMLDRIKQEAVEKVIHVEGFSSSESEMNKEEGLNFLEKHNDYASPLGEDNDYVAFLIVNDQLIFRFESEAT